MQPLRFELVMTSNEVSQSRSWIALKLHVRTSNINPRTSKLSDCAASSFFASNLVRDHSSPLPGQFPNLNEPILVCQSLGNPVAG
jgi:hypothetical protein